MLLSLPEFLWGLFFILLFGVALELLPFTGRLTAGFQRPVVTGFLLLDTLLVGRPDMFLNALKHMILPSLALGIAFAPTIMRVLRSSLLDVYQEDYIHQARLRGFSERHILLRHALKNAILPTLSLMGVQFGFLFGGTLLIEVIYSYPGLGNLMVDAVRNADLPIIQAVGPHLLRRGAHHQHRGRCRLRHPQSEAEDRVSARPAWLRSGRVVFGLSIVVLIALVALFAPWLAPHDPNEQTLLSTFLPPFWMKGGEAAFPLGTDSLGRCTLSRLIYGARIAMTVAIVASFGAMIIGAVLAHIAGYFGGWIDWLIGRTVDVWMSFPPVILSLILMVGLGTGLRNVILAIVLVDWTRFCRVLRSEVLVVTRRDYVAAARLIGFSHWRTITREILPATTPLLITLISLEMGIAVIVEAILSFVGMSVGATTPAWGQMIADARQYIYDSPWNLVFPILMIFVTVLGFNVLGDGLRRTLDVRLTETQRA